MRIWILSVVLWTIVGLAHSSTALLIEDELTNDAPTTSTEFAREGVPTAEVGVFSLVPDDVDYVRVSGLRIGDVLTAVTTPLDAALGLPDTVLGLFDADLLSLRRCAWHAALQALC